MRVRGLISNRHDDSDIGIVAVGDERFCPIENEILTAADGGTASATRI
jgi:hypothetical protein